MKQILIIFFSVLALFAVAQKVPPKPNPPRLVNDYAKLLEPDQKQHLEEKLVAYDDSTSIQIAVVIVPTLDDYEPVDYATKLGREWGVGNKKTNNGVVLLVSVEEGKRRVFIAPGYGLEGALPDIICKRIVEDEIIPEFKQQNYFRGLVRGTDAIIKASRGEYKAPDGYRDRNKGKGDGGAVFVFVLILVLVILFIGRRGGGGRGGGGMISRRGYHDYMPPIWFFPTGGRSSGGGGWSGGGGGFGGFGGGSFGGGGAGGSW